MPSLDGTVARWMRAHRSTVSDMQLADLGVTTDQRRHLVEVGVLERVVDGAYRFVGAPPDELARCLALCASRPELVVSGPTAGRYWAIPRTPRDGLVHVTAPPASNPCRETWVRPYRTALLDPDDVVERIDGIRITNASRTVVDLTRWLTNDALGTAVEHGLSKGLCSIESLYRCAERLDTRGRPWVRRFLRVLDARLPGRPRESSWERRVHDALVERGVTGIESQVYESLPGFGDVRFDLAIPAIRMVIEVDVHPEHRTVEGQAGDCRRDRTSRRVGWAVERVAEAELTDDFESTISDLVSAVADRRREVQRLTDAGLWPPDSTR